MSSKPGFIEYEEPYDAYLDRVHRELENADEEQARVEQERLDRIHEYGDAGFSGGRDGSAIARIPRTEPQAGCVGPEPSTSESRRWSAPAGLLPHDSYPPKSSKGV